MTGLAYVVVLNWNGLSYVRDCLKAILAQTYPAYRVLVVDNASTDGSRDIVRSEFPEAALLPLPDNLHFARGTNEGVRAALRDPACEFVATLNNDTRADPEWLAAMVRSVTDGVGSVASKMLFMDRPKTLNSTGVLIARDGSAMDRGWNEPDQGQYDGRTDVFGPSAGAALYRRGLLEQVGLFDEDFVAYYEDVDLAWRARLVGWDSRFAPRSLVYHKWSGSVGHRSSWRIFQCERNRVWNLVQNYPWRYVTTGASWNAAHVLASLWVRSSDGDSPSNEERIATIAHVHVRARLAAYAGLERALAKRRLRQSNRCVSPATIGLWLRRYGRSVGWTRS